MRLVYSKTKDPVRIGDRPRTFRGVACRVVGFSLPRWSGSTGRVTLQIDGIEGEADYYPAVIGAEWIPQK